jgi:hypothetical protein
MRVGVGLAIAILQVGCFNSVDRSATGPGGSGPCASEPPPGPTPPAGQPDSLYIAGTTTSSCQLSTFVGTAVPLAAVVTDAFGTVLTNQTVTWATSDPTTVIVAGEGLTQAGYVGSADCQATGSATVSATDGVLETSVTILCQ